MAGSHNNLGGLLADLGKQVEAEEQFRKALVLQEKLAVDFPGVLAYRSDLAKSRLNLGNLLAALGKGAEAEEQYRQSLAIHEKLAAEFPTVPAYCVELGIFYCNFGILVRNEGKPADSLEWFAKAIGVLTPLHQQEPRDVQAKQPSPDSHSYSAEICTGAMSNSLAGASG